MGTLNRRDVIRTAAGAALVGGVTVTAQAGPTAGPTGPGAAAATRRRVAGRSRASAVPELPVPEGNPARLAGVEQCRSWSREVYLAIDATTRGFVELSPEGFAIAACCQAQGRPVAVRYWGHEPAARRGHGAFAGAVVAFDLDDLPPAGASLQA